MDYAIFARTSIMRYRSVIIFLPKILSFRRRKMVTYHNGAPTTAVRRDSWTASSTLASKGKKNKLDCAFFSAGRVIFFFFNHPFPVRDPKLVILRLRFLTGGGAEKIGRFCSYEYVCVSIYMCVF